MIRNCGVCAHLPRRQSMKPRRTLTFVAILVLGVSAVRAQENCHDSVVAAWDVTGRTMTLEKDYKYVDPNNVEWLAPKGSVVDGASIPRFLWSLVGGPYEGKYRNASVTHDVACERHDRRWEDVHLMFYNHMICSGVDPAVAKAMYWAVQACGPRWGNAGTRLFPCGSQTQMREYLAEVLCATKKCPGSQIAISDVDVVALNTLASLDLNQLKDQPQIANFDMKQAETPFSPVPPREPEQLAVLLPHAPTELRTDEIRFERGSRELSHIAEAILDDVAL